MKTAHDPRHKRRIILIKKLFSYSFQQKKIDNEIKDIINNLAKIDKLISSSAPEWPITKLNKIDLAILRLAIYELLAKEVPEKVVIDEAVEIAKEYGSNSTPKFVNGVLGTVLEKLKKTNDNKT
jgi:N utilization substance protein B